MKRDLEGINFDGDRNLEETSLNGELQLAAGIVPNAIDSGYDGSDHADLTWTNR